MPGFKRVYNAFPGYDILGNIESVNTIDQQPPAIPLGSGVGNVCVIGEFEDGLVEAPTRVFGSSDMEAKFGGFGHIIDGAPYRYPVAVRSGGAGNYWEGNGYTALSRKPYAALTVVRVDNSAGQVSFTPQATIVAAKGPYTLADLDTLDVIVGGGPVQQAIFTGTAASITGTGAVFPTGFVGGETLELASDRGITRVVTFLAADQTLAQVIARINGALAGDVASDDGGQLKLSSLIEGKSAAIQIVGGSAATTLGLPTTTTAQIDTFTVNVAPTLAGDTYTGRVITLIDGVSTTYDFTFESVTGAETVTQVRDGLLASALALGIPGLTFTAVLTDELEVEADANVTFTGSVAATPNPGDFTRTTTQTPVVTIAYGSGNVDRLDVVRTAEAVAVINGDIPGVTAQIDSDGRLRLVSDQSLLIDPAGPAAAKLGFTTAGTVNTTTTADVQIPAGTLVKDAADGLWLTLTTTTIKAGTTIATDLKVRPAVDDDTTVTAPAGTVTEIVNAGNLPIGFGVTNADELKRLTSAQMDVRYLDAIASTIDVSGVPFDINITFACRTSERIMEGLADNARQATASGHRARKTVLAPAIGTSRADAKADANEGVANVGREQRAGYIFPGFRVFIPEIAELGEDGGPGFTADGLIDQRGDAMYASVRSILPAEENAGQLLSDTVYGGPLNATGLESAYDKELGGIGLQIEDYIDFKANGIIAPVKERTAGLTFQSDVTSVDPTLQPALAPQNRRYMADFIIDSLSDIASLYVKKLNTPIRRRSLLAQYNGFLEGLQSPNQPEASRIRDYAVKDVTSPDLLNQGFLVVEVAVQTYESILYVVNRITVGATVNVEELG